MDTVAIPVYQIPRPDLQASYFDRLAELDDVGIRVRYGNAAREKTEAQGLQCGQIADGAVGHAAVTIEGAPDCSVDFSHERACSRLMIHIFEHHYAWIRN